MATGQACGGDGRGREGGLLRWLHDAVHGFAAELRDGFSRPAMNRRILHRLAGMDEADLSRLGLAGRDVRQAAEHEVADVAAFLTARRELGRQPYKN